MYVLGRLLGSMLETLTFRGKVYLAVIGYSATSDSVALTSGSISMPLSTPCCTQMHMLPSCKTVSQLQESVSENVFCLCAGTRIRYTGIWC